MASGPTPEGGKAIEKLRSKLASRGARGFLGMQK